MNCYSLHTTAVPCNLKHLLLRTVSTHQFCCQFLQLKAQVYTTNTIFTLKNRMYLFTNHTGVSCSNPQLQLSNIIDFLLSKLTSLNSCTSGKVLKEIRPLISMNYFATWSTGISMRGKCGLRGRKLFDISLKTSESKPMRQIMFMNTNLKFTSEFLVSHKEKQFTTL